MPADPIQRRLAAILVADVVGYSRLMGEDEEGTLATLTAHLTELIEPCIREHRGRVVKTTGDGLLAEFASVVDAVQCAVAFQEGMAKRTADAPEDKRISFRIGINMGDIIVQNDDVFGDGVNVAARLEGLAEPGGICVSETVHQNVRSKLELLFNDLGLRRVKNIGDPIRAFHAQPGTLTQPDPSSEELPLLPDKPSIAVLPFENMSADPEQEFFSDGITEDIITELSKISGLFVIARHSAFTYKGKSVTLKQVGRELGVQYVLEGSVRKAADRLRITAQLIDTATDHHLWAERYDRDIEDIFAVQDEVARHVAGELSVTLKPSERENLAHAPTENLEAYDLYVRSRTRITPPTRDNIESAKDAFDAVIRMDPSFAGGYAGKSIAHSMAVLFDHSTSPNDEAQVAMELGEKAVSLDNEFARSHSALGTSYTAMGRHEEAVEAAGNATKLQPGDADSHASLGRCLMWAGSFEEAVGSFLGADRLDPRFVEGPYLNLMGRALFLARQYEASIEAFERNKARGGPGGGSTILYPWIAACALSDRMEAARPLILEFQRIYPEFRLTQLREKPQVRCVGEIDILTEGLRKAGLPD